MFRIKMAIKAALVPAIIGLAVLIVGVVLLIVFAFVGGLGLLIAGVL